MGCGKVVAVYKRREIWVGFWEILVESDEFLYLDG